MIYQTMITDLDTIHIRFILSRGTKGGTKNYSAAEGKQVVRFRFQVQVQVQVRNGCCVGCFAVLC